MTHTSNGFNFPTLPETNKHYSHHFAAALARPLKHKQDFESLGIALKTICKLAFAAREVSVLREVSDFLVSLPIQEQLRTMGEYYQGKVLLETGKVGAAQTIFEQLANNRRFPWKMRAIASIAGCHLENGNLDDATRLHLEASRLAGNGDFDLVTLLKSQLMIGRIQSIQGDHDIALKSLEGLYPLACYLAKTDSVTYYDYLNSRAARLIALNRFAEAESLCDVFLAAPFAINFPNWSETRDELREAREAVAATIFVNIQRLPEEKLRAKARAIETPECAAALVTRLSIISLEEIESILNSRLFFDRAAIEIIQSQTEAQINPSQAISVLSKPHSDIAFVLYLGVSIASTSKQRTVQPAVNSQARPLLVAINVVPDNRRPRAPPTTFQIPTKTVR